MPRGKKKKTDRVAQELLDIRAMAIGLEAPRKKKASSKSPILEPEDHLSRQLSVLKTMFEQKKNDDYFSNFDYITQRALFTMKTRRASEFGDVRIYRPAEMLATLFAKTS